MDFIHIPGTQPDGFKDLSLNNFITPVSNFPTIQQTSKIEKFDVSLTFVNAKVNNGKYVFLFVNSIISKDFSTPNMIVNASQIDYKQLQQVIMSKVDKKDLKYIKLRDFSTSKTTFVFDIDSWLDDALKNVKGRVFLSRYDKEYRLNIQPPTMVRYYGIRVDFQRYVANYFKDYVRRKPQYRNVLFDSVPKNYENTLKTHIANMFEYEYDFQVNRIIVRLKTIFLTGLIFSTYALSNESKNNIPFGEMVKKNLSMFPKDKLNKIIPKKFF